MRINWLGHSCFLLETSQGTRLVTDPYESGGYGGAVGYDPINLEADIVTVSHHHADHNNIQDFRKALIVSEEGKVSIKDVEIKGMLSYHDKDKGQLRGENIIFTIQADGLKIVHFGDLGEKDIDLTPFMDIDIAIVPVGGTFTIDAVEASQLIRKISPKITIPMHYKTSKLRFNIDGVNKFLKANPDYEKKDSLGVSLDNIKSFKRIVVLKYQR